MKLKHMILIASGIILLALPSLVQAEDYGTVHCQYITIPGLPIAWYDCTDGSRWFNYDAMIANYVPPMIQTEPDVTFVTGGNTETFTP